VSDSRSPLARYLEQRVELGEDLVVLPAVGEREGRAIPSGADVESRGLGVAVGDSESQDATEGIARPSRSPMRPPTAATQEAKWKKNAPPIPERGVVVSSPGKDLFTEDPLANTSLEALTTMIRSCPKCRLAEHRTHAVPGEGPADARLMVVGEGPGAKEDETGRPFVGRAGELLTEILAAIGMPRETVFICNIVKCRPPNNRKPQQDEIDACVPYLYRQIELVRPGVILAMGGTAAETLLGVKQSLGQLRNRVHEFRGIPLVVTYHPAALLRNPHWKKPTWDDVRIARQLLDQRD
jgi:uracil-DNA glycosylase family 4